MTSLSIKKIFLITLATLAGAAALWLGYLFVAGNSREDCGGFHHITVNQTPGIIHTLLGIPPRSSCKAKDD